jgi:hypothetical protein
VQLAFKITLIVIMIIFTNKCLEVIDLVLKTKQSQSQKERVDAQQKRKRQV